MSPKLQHCLLALLLSLGIGQVHAELPTTESIWPRLVAGMRLGGEDRPEVKRFIAHYRANPGYFTAMLARAEPFLWYILNAAETRRLPTELALLPTVESSWNAQAVSVSSAYGLWQFIPKTGDAYGLKDALNYDARRDPVASTTAALHLLSELHREYGDWPLALAAYNTGGVRLKQAIKNGRTRNFWRLPLPPVTQDYVPRLLAIAALVRSPGRYGVTLPPIAESGVAELISLDSAVPLHVALAAAGVDQEVLRVFNPALRTADSPTQSPTLLLPPADAIAVRAELALLQQAMTPLSAALHIAAPAPAFNDNASSDSILIAAQKIRDLPAQMHWDLRIGSAQETASMRMKPDHYQVRRGDTLFDIGKRHGMSVAQLKRMNPDAGSTSLRAGQILKVNECSRRDCG
ncbi:MAG: transglycosylase SLT domain-containing protein [Stagnimonas sp.]|nr:transglycosylase SLT domain-containing protein [Stagnimonas sp.]